MSPLGIHRDVLSYPSAHPNLLTVFVFLDFAFSGADSKEANRRSNDGTPQNSLIGS
jgi:hypothetical protein